MPTTATPTAHRPRAATALAILGLYSLGVTIPVLLRLGDAPQFFVSHGISGGGLVLFALGLTAGAAVPIGAYLLATAVVRSPVVEQATVGAMSALAAAGLLHALGPVVVWLAAVAAAVTGWRLYPAARPVREWLPYTATGSVVALVLFVVATPAGELVGGDGSGEAAPASTTPVVVLVLDELPTTALMDSSGAVNAARFPAFARLAATATWYRGATTAGADTSHAVPSIWSGVRPPATPRAPTASQYPRSIFTMFGTDRDVRVAEPITAVCPRSVCEATADEQETRPATSLATTVDDTFIVAADTVLPAPLDRAVPSLAGRWSHFRQAEAAGQASGAEASVDKSANPWDAAASLQRLLADEPTGQPLLVVGHLLSPHLPYQANPSGSAYAYRMAPPGIDRDTLTWEDGADAGLQQTYAQLLFQTGFVDSMLGQAIDRLQAMGVWDDAVVVVTADHGASFAGAGTTVRQLNDETAHVPLFVKYPGQRRGVVDDTMAMTIDVLPTLERVAGLDTGWDLDGIALADEGGEPAGVAEREDRTIDLEGVPGTGARHRGEHRPDWYAPVLARNATWLDLDGGWETAGLAAELTAFAGADVAALAPAENGGSWVERFGGDFARTDTDGLEGATSRANTALDLIIAVGPNPPAHVVVAVDGKVAASGSYFRPDGERHQVRVVVPEAYLDGARTLEVLVHTDGRFARLVEASP